MRTVFVGAGHGGSDSGAVSADGSLIEARLAMTLRNAICGWLHDKGVPFKTDGAEEENLVLKRSIAIAQTCDGPRVELHFNAGPPKAKGVEALSLVAHKSLAQQLATAVAGATESPLRGELGWKPDDSGQHHRLAFCREGGGVILEVEFISNPVAMATYNKMVQGIAMRIGNVLAHEAGYVS